MDDCWKQSWVANNIHIMVMVWQCVDLSASTNATQFSITCTQDHTLQFSIDGFEYQKQYTVSFDVETNWWSAAFEKRNLWSKVPQRADGNSCTNAWISSQIKTQRYQLIFVISKSWLIVDNWKVRVHLIISQFRIEFTTSEVRIPKS